MREKLVLIGASTGGPGHLKKIFNDLPSSLNVPIVVAQHMDSWFIPSFVKQLNNELQASVFMLNEKTTLSQGGIYICEKNFKVEHFDPLRATPIQERSNEMLYNPNVDALFNSAVKICKNVDVLAILLTGIGNDGAEGLKNLALNGANVIAESEESAIVYGMPKKAKELNANLKVLHLEKIKREMERFCNVF